MQIVMGQILYLVGIVLTGYAGYSGLDWYFIFISALIMAVGYFIIRSPQIIGIVKSDGAVALPKLALIHLIVFSVITAPVYFIASVFS